MFAVIYRAYIKPELEDIRSYGIRSQVILFNIEAQLVPVFTKQKMAHGLHIQDGQTKRLVMLHGQETIHYQTNFKEVRNEKGVSK